MTLVLRVFSVFVFVDVFLGLGGLTFPLIDVSRVFGSGRFGGKYVPGLFVFFVGLCWG